MTPKQRLKICIIGQVLLLISVIIPTVLLANKESTYYRFGPSKDLIIISVKINTWDSLRNFNGVYINISYLQGIYK